MKKGTYIASTNMEGGAVMFRIDGESYTLRKDADLTVEITERSKVIYPAEYMTLTLKSESGTKNVKKEIKPKVEKVEKGDKKLEKSAPMVPEKGAEKTPTKTPRNSSTKTTKTTKTAKTVKIETEEK